jgi:DNA mismatch repair protein MutS
LNAQKKENCLYPAEFLLPEKFHTKHVHLFEELRQSYTFLINQQADWHFDSQSTFSFLTQHFGVHSLDGFGIQKMIAGITAAGALLRYIQNVLSLPIHHIQSIRSFSTSHYVSLDRVTQRNLELVTALQDGNRKNTLIGVLDQTLTPMGARLIHQWITQPLISLTEIHLRQKGIQAFLQQESILDMARQNFLQIKDIERLMIKISAGYATPRDLIALSYCFTPIGALKVSLSTLPSEWIQEKVQFLDPLTEMNQRIIQALVEEPPLKIGEGKTFKSGFHLELDELREISTNSKSWIAHYQTQLREETGIKTLKVGFNKMFGYYIEVSRGQVDRMPTSFCRRQTLVNAERYISPVLKEYESKVLTAEERIQAIENELFHQLRQEIAQYAKAVLHIARAVAHLDCLSTLAILARQHHYCCPLVDKSQIISIVEGKHPVLDQICMKEKFIPNDTYLDTEQQRLILLTGPNMGGKSTYLRQVALLVIMAQIGSFIPAQEAHIGIVDKIFTRIGASDDLAKGQSTFMVEMSETANILHNVTPHSLVILDEIGRGTSTYDGISIAWSIAEYLLTTEHRMAKTLFATHYWELTKLEDKIPGAVNYHVAVHETEEQISFLRKIVKGGTDKSYGIHVARLAGLPLSVVHRSKQILAHLEENANRKSAFEPPKNHYVRPKIKDLSLEQQLSLF